MVFSLKNQRLDSSETVKCRSDPVGAKPVGGRLEFVCGCVGSIEHLSEFGFAANRERRPMRPNRLRTAASNGSDVPWIQDSVKRPLSFNGRVV
jgi:hypothetical protein